MSRGLLSMLPRLTALDRRVINAIPICQWRSLAQIAHDARMGATVAEVAEVAHLLEGMEHLGLVLHRGGPDRWAASTLGRAAAHRPSRPKPGGAP